MTLALKRRMSKRKYFPVKRVVSLDEVTRHRWFVVKIGDYMKTYHCGWLQSMQLRQVQLLIDKQLLYVAERKDNG